MRWAQNPGRQGRREAGTSSFRSTLPNAASRGFEWRRPPSRHCSGSPRRRDTDWSTLEKVLRLLELLDEIAQDPVLSQRLALKGGTALNVFYLDLDRLSVDIDLNYVGALDLAARERERADAFPDQAATADTAFSYEFPANTFTDADDDPLTYTATRDDDMELPPWLTFAADTRTFSGTPQAGDVRNGHREGDGQRRRGRDGERRVRHRGERGAGDSGRDHRQRIHEPPERRRVQPRRHHRGDFHLRCERDGDRNTEHRGRGRRIRHRHTPVRRRCEHQDHRRAPGNGDRSRPRRHRRTSHQYQPSMWERARSTTKDVPTSDANIAHATVSTATPLRTRLIRNIVVTSQPFIPPVFTRGQKICGIGEALDFTVEFADTVSITGQAPVLHVKYGAHAYEAGYESGSESSQLRFRWITPDTLEEGKMQPAIEANIGPDASEQGVEATLTDSQGNTVNDRHGAFTTDVYIDVSKPTLLSTPEGATVNGSRVDLVYRDAQDPTRPDSLHGLFVPRSSDYTLTAGERNIAVSRIKVVDADRVELLLAEPVREGETVTLDYTAQGSRTNYRNHIVDQWQNTADPFTGRNVRNDTIDSGNSFLATLSIPGFTFEPAFHPAENRYWVTSRPSVSAPFTVTAATQDPDATIEYYGYGLPPSPRPGPRHGRAPVRAARLRPAHDDHQGRPGKRGRRAVDGIQAAPVLPGTERTTGKSQFRHVRGAEQGTRLPPGRRSRHRCRVR